MTNVQDVGNHTLYPIHRTLPLKHRQYEKSGRALINSLLRAETLLLSVESIRVDGRDRNHNKKQKVICNLIFRSIIDNLKRVAYVYMRVYVSCPLDYLLHLLHLSNPRII